MSEREEGGQERDELGGRAVRKLPGLAGGAMGAGGARPAQGPRGRAGRAAAVAADPLGGIGGVHHLVESRDAGELPPLRLADKPSEAVIVGGRLSVCFGHHS